MDMPTPTDQARLINELTTHLTRAPSSSETITRAEEALAPEGITLTQLHQALHDHPPEPAPEPPAPAITDPTPTTPPLNPHTITEVLARAIGASIMCSATEEALGSLRPRIQAKRSLSSLRSAHLAILELIEDLEALEHLIVHDPELPAHYSATSGHPQPEAVPTHKLLTLRQLAFLVRSPPPAPGTGIRYSANLAQDPTIPTAEQEVAANVLAQIEADQALAFDCPRCQAGAGTPCRVIKGPRVGEPTEQPHRPRIDRIYAEPAPEV